MPLKKHTSTLVVLVAQGFNGRGGTFSLMDQRQEGQAADGRVEPLSDCHAGPQCR
jgi:hypothetical protein